MIYESFDLLSIHNRVVYDVPYPVVLVWLRGFLRYSTAVERTGDALSPPLQTLSVRDAVYEYELVLAHMRDRFKNRDVRVYTSLQIVDDTNPILYLSTKVTMGVWACHNRDFVAGHDGTRRPSWFHFAVGKFCDPPSRLCPTAWEHIQKNNQGT